MSGTKLDGAYIPADGSYGLRLELEGSRFLLLWRNSPVLDTKYKLNADGELSLKENGLRTAYDNEPYATLTSCRLEGEQIVLTEFFPISGESVTALVRTEHSRYGNVTVVNDTVLPLLQGKWSDERGFISLSFKGDKVTVNGDRTEYVAAIKYNWETGNNFKIINKDPSKDYIVHFLPFDFDGETLRAGIPVCDAPTMFFILTKK